MKKLARLAGIITLAAVIGLSFIACDNGTSPAGGAKPGSQTNEFTISFNLNGGYGTAPDSITAEAGNTVTLPDDSTFYFPGYNFAGWKDDINTPTLYLSPGDIVLGPDTINKGTVLYANWTDIPYASVTFESNGGSSVPTQPYVVQGGVAYRPPTDPTRRGYNFDNWYSDEGLTIVYDFSTQVTDHIKVYAKWNKKIMPGGTLADRLAWVAGNSIDGEEYIFEIDQDEALNTCYLGYEEMNVTLILKGVGGMRVIKPKNSTSSSYSNIFTLSKNVTMILDENITLDGDKAAKPNTDPLVVINRDATFIMNAGTRIINNNSGQKKDGGYYIGYARGSAVENYGVFIMNGGEISGNDALTWTGHATASSSGSTTTSYGGGVYNNGTFTMNSGKIIDNTAEANSLNTARCSSQALGGGVYNTGTFNMNGGEISGNKAKSAVSSCPSGNASSQGGGVYNSGTFNMNGGEISGNEASPYSFSSGTTSSQGGGVYNTGAFNMGGDVIYGSDEADTTLRNTASNGGRALYNHTSGTAQYGTFGAAGIFSSTNSLSTSENTIKVIGGVLQ